MNNRITQIALSLMLISAATAHSDGKTPADTEAPFPYPSAQQSQDLYDELDYQRAVQVAIWAQPLVGQAAWLKGRDASASNRCNFLFLTTRCRLISIY
jgi:hypothetical protein